MEAPPSVPATIHFKRAWRLFRQLHDAPSLRTAEELVLWLGQHPAHVYALDDALTLWALAGGALVQASAQGESTVMGRLQ